VAPKSTVAPKQKRSSDREVWTQWRDVFDDLERFAPGLAFEQQTLDDLKGPRLEQAIARVRARLDAEKPLEAALEALMLRSAPDAEQEKAASGLRKAREASREAASRVEALERAIPQQEALVRRMWGEVITGIRTAYEPAYRKIVGELGATAIRLAELVSQEVALRDTACAELRRAARGAGHPHQEIGPGMPAMGGMWDRHVGTQRDPNSNVSLWLRAARDQGYDVGGED
jgi:hypothetical protein